MAQDAPAKDTIYLIAPATPASEGTVAYATALFKEMGFNTASSPGISVPYYNWGNTAAHRADQIIQALNDPKAKAIYALEGGEGACEVVAELKKREGELLRAPSRGIPLIGFSNITYLHHYLGERGLATPVQGPPFSHLTSNRDYVIASGNQLAHVDLSTHSPDAAKQQIEAWEKAGSIVSRPRSDEDARAHQANAQALRQFLLSESEQSFALTPVNIPAKHAGKLTGMLVGGNDMITQMSGYTTHGPHIALHAAVEQPILFLESKKIEDLRHTLHLLKQSGDLGRYRAIILGKYTGNMEDKNPDFPAHQVNELLRQSGIADTIPVFHGITFGHAPRGAEMQPVALYTPGVIEHGTLTIAHQAPATELHRRSAFKPTPSEHKPALSPAVAVHEVNLDQPWATILHRLHGQDIAGKDLVIHFPFNKQTLSDAQATINPVHCLLMPLVASGKLQSARSLTLTADGDYAPAFNAWLDEFAQKWLPGMAVSTAVQKSKETPEIPKAHTPHEGGYLAPVWDYVTRLLGYASGAGHHR